MWGDCVLIGLRAGDRSRWRRTPCRPWRRRSRHYTLEYSVVGRRIVHRGEESNRNAGCGMSANCSASNQQVTTFRLCSTFPQRGQIGSLGTHHTRFGSIPTPSDRSCASSGVYFLEKICDDDNFEVVILLVHTRCSHLGAAGMRPIDRVPALPEPSQNGWLIIPFLLS